MVPLRAKLEKKLFKKKPHQSPNLVSLKKLMPKSQVRRNLNPHSRNTPFLNIFNLQKVLCEQIYDFKP